MFNVKVCIKPEEVYQYFLDHKEELKDKMDIVATTDTDDFDKKSFLFLTNESGELFLSLEAPGLIVNSEYCSESNTEDNVNKLLTELDKLYPIVLHRRFPSLKYNDNQYVCELTKEIDKYLIGLSDIYCSYLYDFSPRKEHDGKEGYIYTIRSPGSTKGCVFVDNQGIITEVKFYSDSLGYFKPEVKILEKELLGYQLEMGV